MERRHAVAYKPVYETREFRAILPKSELFLSQSKELARQSREVAAEDRTQAGASGDSIELLSEVATASPFAPPAFRVRELARKLRSDAEAAYLAVFKRSRYRDAVEQARYRVETGQLVPSFRVEWNDGELLEADCRCELVERSQRGAA